MTVSGKDQRGLVEKLRTLRTRLDRLERRNAELVQAENELRKSLEQFKTIFDDTLVGLYRTTPDGRFLMANPVLVSMLGYSSFDELARRNLEQEGCDPEYTRSVFKERIEREGKVIGLECAWKRSDGTALYVRESAQAVRDESGKTLYYQGTVEDITQHRQTKRALHESELFVALAASLSEGVNIIDENLCCLFANPAGEKIFGVEPDGLVGRNLHEFVSDEGHAIVEEQRSKRREGIASSYDLEIIRADGQKRQLIVTASPRLSQDGKYVGALAVFFDVTEKKQAEEALRKAHDELEMRVQERTAELERANKALQAQVVDRIKAERTRIASEMRYCTTLDAMGDAIHVVDSNLRIVLANKRFWQWSEEVGVEVADAIGRTIFDLFPFLPNKVRDEYRQVFDSGRVLNTEETNTVADREIATETRKIPIEEAGRVVRVITVIRDITERKEAEQALKETTELLETIFAHTHILVAYLDRQFNFVRVNRAYAEADGREVSFYPGRNHFDLFPNAENEAIFRKVVEIGVPYFAHARPFEYAEHRERGVSYWDWSLVPIKQQDGVVSGLVLTLVNVTEQKRAEQALRDREATLGGIFRAAPVGIGLERDWVLVRVNDTICEMLGYSGDELVGRHAKMFYPSEEDSERVRGETRRQILEKGKGTVETQWKRKDGRTIDVLLSTTVLDPADFLKGVTFTALDITERKAAEEAIRESGEKFRTLAEQSPNMIFINKKGRVVYANKRCEEIMGYPREQLYSPDFSFLSLIAPESIDTIKEHFARHAKGEEIPPYDYSLVDKQGRRIEAINASKLIPYEGETAILGIVTDITERKKAEQALCESQERLKILFESAPDAIYVTDLVGRFVDCNKTAEELVGFTKAELLGRNLAESLLMSAEDLSRAAVNVRKVASGQPSGPTEYTVRRKSGSLIAVEVRTFPVRISDQVVSLGIARDITDRKQAQQRLLEDREQLKSLASQLSLTEERERRRLATELHDQIGQSLVISKIKLDQLRRNESSGELSNALDEVSACLGRAINDTRTLTFDLSYPILYELGFEAAVAEWLTEHIQEKHGIETAFEDDGQSKPLDDDIRALLFRNVRELLINVVKHSRARRVKVTTRRVKDQIRISVEDDGVGFDPVEVTAMAARRAEFGLFSIRERLEQLGGLFEVVAAPGRGTKITMTAPLKYQKKEGRSRR